MELMENEKALEKLEMMRKKEEFGEYACKCLSHGICPFCGEWLSAKEREDHKTAFISTERGWGKRGWEVRVLYCVCGGTVDFHIADGDNLWRVFV